MEISEIATADRVAFNINHCVRVRLTDMGRELHAADHVKFWAQRLQNFPYSPPKEDAEGWSKWQLWALMECFGQHVGLGMKEPMFTEIEFYAKDLTPVTVSPAEPGRQDG